MILPGIGTAVLLAGTPLSASTQPPPVPLPLAALAVTEQATPVQSPPPPQTQTQTVPPRIGREPGDIVVTARKGTLGDPLENVNAKSFAITQKVDGAFVRPVTRAYEKALPKPVRNGLRNLLSNLREPIVFANFMLQIKIGKAAETVGRFAINSTAGVAGLFDIAKRRPFRLPKRVNGFADTLGLYGVGSGPFLFLPLVGPTTLRDVIGGGVDGLLLPTVVGKPFTQNAYRIPVGILTALNRRSEVDQRLTELRKKSDPYVAVRESYMRTRQAEIDHLRGRRRGEVETPDAVISPYTSPPPVPIAPQPN